MMKTRDFMALQLRVLDMSATLAWRGLGRIAGGLWDVAMLPVAMVLVGVGTPIWLVIRASLALMSRV